MKSRFNRLSTDSPGRFGKDLGKSSNLKAHGKSHRINGPCVLYAHNPKVVSSNLTPATIFRWLKAGTQDFGLFFFASYEHWAVVFSCKSRKLAGIFRAR